MRILRASSEWSSEERRRFKRGVVIATAGGAILLAAFVISKTLSNSIQPRLTVATFAGIDSTTRGNWTGIYGKEGFSLANDAAGYPRYAEVVAPMEVATWAASTDDQRALQRPGQTDRVASTWYGWSNLMMDVRFTDEQVHRLTVYCIDWDSIVRAQTIEVIDAVNNVVLDYRTIATFTEGRYLTWDVSGNVRIRINRLAGANAVLSGLFFD